MTESNSESAPMSRMTGGATPEAVLELGKALASELDDTDTLGRWMAHYISEQLAALEGLDGQNRHRAEADSVELILRLWEHRRVFPTRRPILSAVDSVERALVRLDSQRSPWEYFDVFAGSAEPTDDEVELNSILKVALALDESVGDLVRTLIAYAAAIASEQDQQWLARAKEVGDSTLLFQAIRDLTRADEPDDDAKGQGWQTVLLKRVRHVSQSLEFLERALGDQPPSDTSDDPA